HVTQSTDGKPVFAAGNLRVLLDPTESDHLDRTAYPNALMSPTLGLSTRRLPAEVDSDTLKAAWSSAVSEFPVGDWTPDIHFDKSSDPIKPAFVLLAEAAATGLANPNSGIVNGDFAVGNPNLGGYGWTSFGPASVQNSAAVFNDGNLLFTDLSQT